MKKRSILAVLSGLISFWVLSIILVPFLVFFDHISSFGVMIIGLLAGIVVGYIARRKGSLHGLIAGLLSGLTIPTTFLAIAIPILGIIAPQIVSNSKDISIDQMNKLYIDIFLVFITVVIFETLGGFIGVLLYKKKNENWN